MIDMVYVGNVSLAILLASDSLLDPSSQVGGKVAFIFFFKYIY